MLGISVVFSFCVSRACSDCPLAHRRGGGVVCLGVMLSAVFLLKGRISQSGQAVGRAGDLERAQLGAEAIPAGLAELNLPVDFVRRVSQRTLMDEYAARFHVVEAELESKVVLPTARHRPDEWAVRLVRPQFPDEVRRYRLALDQPVVPLRGFRAPILDEAEGLRPVAWMEDAPASQRPQSSVYRARSSLSPKERAAAECIREKLAFDGLMVTLARCLEILGPERFATNAEAGARELRDLGFPTDWLQFFSFDPASEAGCALVVAHVARELLAGLWTADLEVRLRAVPMHFRKAHAHYRAVEETGGADIRLLRVQVGGGYRGGIIPGGSIDVSGQLVAAVPEADLLVTVPEEHLENVRWLIQSCWLLRRTNQVTLIPEKLGISAWAQDNGKAGVLVGEGVPATLAPRYASKREVNADFLPSESFLMDGLRAAGHAVVHSPLHFQGGNLLVVRDPARNERVLLLSETTVCRNTTLGLTREQVLEAFAMEFGVDRCVVLPTVSYHLDYDVSLRVHDGQVLAFVNDTMAAARLILERALEAFRAGGVTSAGLAAEAREDLLRTNAVGFLEHVAEVVRPLLNERHQYRVECARLFATAPGDSPVFNLQSFCAAMDVLASLTLTGANQPKDDFSRRYFGALRELQATAGVQQAVLRELGWKVIPVPSMPDLYRSLNYLNGVHDRRRYLMPALGGFYAPLDEAAAKAFQEALGTDVKIVRIFTQELQRQHGALHCVAAAYSTL